MNKIVDNPFFPTAFVISELLPIILFFNFDTEQYNVLARIYTAVGILIIYLIYKLRKNHLYIFFTLKILIILCCSVIITIKIYKNQSIYSYVIIGTCLLLFLLNILFNIYDTLDTRIKEIEKRNKEEKERQEEIQKEKSRLPKFDELFATDIAYDDIVKINLYKFEEENRQKIIKQIPEDRIMNRDFDNVLIINLKDYSSRYNLEWYISDIWRKERDAEIEKIYERYKPKSS